MQIENEERSPYLSLYAPIESVNVLHHRPKTGRTQHIEQDETFQQHDDEFLHSNWRDRGTVADKYGQHQPEFL